MSATPSRVVTPALSISSTTSFIFIWNLSGLKNKLDLGASQTPSAVKTYAKKSLNFSALALSPPSAPYKPWHSVVLLFPLMASRFSLNCFYYWLDDLLQNTFFFSHPSCGFLLICFLWAFLFISASFKLFSPTIASFAFFFYELYKVFIEQILLAFWYVIHSLPGLLIQGFWKASRLL